MGFSLGSLFSGDDGPNLKDPPPFTDLGEVLVDGYAKIRNKDGKISVMRTPRNPFLQKISDYAIKEIQSNITKVNEIQKTFPNILPSIAPQLTAIAQAIDSKQEYLGNILNIPNLEQQISDYKASQTQAINKYYDTAGAGAIENLRSLGYSVDSTASRDIQSRYDNARGEALTKLDETAMDKGRDWFTRDLQNSISKTGALMSGTDSITNDALKQRDLEMQQFQTGQDTAMKEYNVANEGINRGFGFGQFDENMGMQGMNMAYNIGSGQQDRRNAYNLQATQIENQNEMQRYQAQQAQRDSMLGGIGSAVGMALGGPVGGMIGNMAGNALSGGGGASLQSRQAGVYHSSDVGKVFNGAPWQR